VLMCGIPGAGKTTIAMDLVEYWNRNYCTTDNTVASRISFDDLESFIEWNHSSFKMIRQENLCILEKLMSPEIRTKLSKTTPSLVVVDDIMYLRSMRRQVYVLARNMGIPMLTVSVSVGLDTAISRNSERSIPVKVESLRKIYESFQIPDPKFIFDRNHISICSEYSACSHTVESIVNTIKSLHSTYVPRIVLVKNVSFHKSSLVKDVDSQLRKIISDVLKELASRIYKSTSAEEQQQLTCLLNSLRLKLSDIKATVLQEVRAETNKDSDSSECFIQLFFAVVMIEMDQLSQINDSPSVADYLEYLASFLLERLQ